MAGLEQWTVSPQRLWPGEVWADVPIALIDLDVGGDAPDALILPPCPVIGFGDRAHPLATALDVVIEPPFTLSQLAREVLAAPLAAAACVRLLRLLAGLGLEDALTSESMAYAMLQGSAEHRRWLAARGAAPPVEPGRVAASREGAVLTITLDRAGAGNAIDRAMRDALFEAFSLAALDPTIATVELRARGRSFSLGADLAEFGTTRDPARAHALRWLTLPARPASRCAAKLHAHVQGACVGAGLELAAFAARVTASADAWFQLPELTMGILPGAGGCVSLSRRIGRQRTALLSLSGRRLNARQAREWGLIDAIVDEPA